MSAWNASRRASSSWVTQLQSGVWPGHVSRSQLAQSLDRCLRELEMFAGNNGLVGFTQGFQQAISRDIKTPWLLSTGEDLRYPGTEGKRSLSIRLLNRYMRRVIELAASDQRVTATLLRVRNLLKPLSTLFQPRIILAVLRRELAAFRRQTTVTAPANQVSMHQAKQRAQSTGA
jgi:hypothetical protein